LAAFSIAQFCTGKNGTHETPQLSANYRLGMVAAQPIVFVAVRSKTGNNDSD